ncbi:hypothetical protein [Mycolicibacter kumamotonensis]|uniref:hypothetical protein n=1 Tax=Mycolicibacter kumamotonensis TaxID=354243 RepID=UPI0013F4F0D3|nr:hypothetical protein [Mycolicibacter kumamotonensis]
MTPPERRRRRWQYDNYYYKISYSDRPTDYFRVPAGSTGVGTKIATDTKRGDPPHFAYTATGEVTLDGGEDHDPCAEYFFDPVFDPRGHVFYSSDDGVIYKSSSDCSVDRAEPISPRAAGYAKLSPLAVSPDGSTLVFVRDNLDFFKISTSGTGTPTRLNVTPAPTLTNSPSLNLYLWEVHAWK